MWKRRLEETAYILFKTDKDREAREALSAAINLKNPCSPIEPNPFIWNLLLKSIYSQFEEDSPENEKRKNPHLLFYRDVHKIIRGWPFTRLWRMVCG